MRRTKISGHRNHRFFSKHLSPMTGHSRRTHNFKPRHFLTISRGGFRV